MGLFDKKFCDICGEKISFLGNHKLEDGNMCGTCNKKMSPYFSGRRKTTVAEMKEHLAEREANRAKLATFNANQVFGDSKKVYIDTVNGNFVVTYANPSGFDKDNPDVLPLSAVNRVDIEVKEQREEEFARDGSGNHVSYNPPRYRYFYDFRCSIGVNWKWFDEIEFNLNTMRVEGFQSAKYHQCEMMGQQIRAALTGQPMPVMQQTYASQPMTASEAFSAFADATATAAATSTAATANTVASGATVAVSGANVAMSAAQAPGQNAQPAPVQVAPVQAAQTYAPAQPVQAAQTSQTSTGFTTAAPNWMCPSCGRSNDGAFCKNCGTKKPEPKPVTTHTEFKTAAPNWMCPSCGRSNDGAFCSNCGTKRPEQRKKCASCGWVAPAEGAVPNFCPQCGSKL